MLILTSFYVFLFFFLINTHIYIYIYIYIYIGLKYINRSLKCFVLMTTKRPPEKNKLARSYGIIATCFGGKLYFSRELKATYTSYKQQTRLRKSVVQFLPHFEKSCFENLKSAIKLILVFSRIQKY